MKSIFLTKTFWFNVIMIAIDISVLLETVFPTNPKLIVVVGLVHGIGNIILRRFTYEPTEFKLPGV